MKSAYDLALERLARQGIEPPRAEGLPEHTRARIEEVRRRAEAELAELEILRRDRVRKLADAGALEQAEERYSIDRRRIEERRDRELARLRREHRPDS